jgi:hypothetical protein
MSVEIMSSDRRMFADAERAQGSIEEKVHAFDTHASCCGRYELFGNEVEHQIELSSFPNWVGTKKRRVVSLEGDELRLATEPQRIGEDTRTAILVWKRT